MVEVREIRSNRGLKKFIRFADELYADNPHYVPTLMMDELATLRADKNPAYENCRARFFLAFRDGRAVGRIGAILNRAYNEKVGQNRLRVTRVDFIDDDEVVDALFDTIEDWARQLGCDRVHGPIGFCDLDHQGLLVEGFDQMGMYITLYNHAYYPGQFERRGYVKEIDWIEFMLTVPKEREPRIARISEAMLQRLKLRLAEFKSPKDIIPYVPQAFDLLNRAYEKLYGVVPITARMRDFYIKMFFSFLNPDFVSVVLDEGGNVAGFAAAMPSLAQAARKSRGNLFPFGFIHLLRALKKPEGLEMMLIAVDEPYRGKGVNAIMLDQMHKSCIRYGVRWAETGPELETNDQVRSQWKLFEARQHKRRRCYIKLLDE